MIYVVYTQPFASFTQAHGPSCSDIINELGAVIYPSARRLVLASLSPKSQPQRMTFPQVLELTPEREILWRGWREGRHAPPSDAPPCGFDNEHCQPRPMIVFALCAMAVALLVGAGFAWR